MRIVDAQIHLWGSGLPSNMAHRQVTSFTTEEAVGLMDEGGVDAAVIHPPGWDPNATEMAFKAVRDFPGRFAILGAFPLSQPDKRALVETWRSQPGMLGLRYGFLQEPMRGWLADGTLDWLWAAAERAGAPIAMLLLAAVRGDVHGGATLAVRAGQGSRHGPGRVRLVGLESAGLTSDLGEQSGGRVGQRGPSGLRQRHPPGGTWAISKASPDRRGHESRQPASG